MKKMGLNTKIQNISWYLEDEMSGIDQPKIEEVQNLCEILNLPFNKSIVMALIYGDNNKTQERLLPKWLKELR